MAVTLKVARLRKQLLNANGILAVFTVTTRLKLRLELLIKVNPRLHEISLQLSLVQNE